MSTTRAPNFFPLDFYRAGQSQIQQDGLLQYCYSRLLYSTLILRSARARGFSAHESSVRTINLTQSHKFEVHVLVGRYTVKRSDDVQFIGEL
jgi:hypothetical protein